MWTPGYHIPKPKKYSSLEKLQQVKGNLEIEKAQKWFAEYCYANPHFTTKLLTGVNLYPIQDILIRAFFLRDFSLLIAGRGFSKSFTICIFIILFALFNPGVKIIICSGTFRQSKLIFKQLERFMDGDDGMFLRQCITKNPSHSTDCYEMEINKSLITAVPLTEKIRGLRANLVVVDELFLVSTEIMNSVIRPFLNVKFKGKEQDEQKRAEDILVKEGKLKEWERTPQINNKMIGLSSASFQVEALYKDHYAPYINGIQDKYAKAVNHFVARLSYEAAPATLLDMNQIEDAKRTSSTQQFDKEYRALFPSESGGYYSIQHILAACLNIGERPTVKLAGDPGKKYILSIDPNYSDSEVADDFAMCVLELDEESQSGVVVHAYALAKSSLTKRAQYFKYLLDNFNIVYIIVDNAGGPKFIEDCKQFLGNLPKDLQIINGDFMSGPHGIREAANSYNYSSGRIIHPQVFSQSGWIRLANETLSAYLEHGKIKFGSRVFEEVDVERLKSVNIPTDLEYAKEGLVNDFDNEDEMFNNSMKEDFAAHLYDVIVKTTTQLSSIDVSTTDMGAQRFDLPKSQKNNKGVNRMRKDSYVALLMAAWGMKCYFDIIKEDDGSNFTFRPIRIH